MKISLAVVSVIMVSNGCLKDIRSFKENISGNKAAEKMFKEFCFKCGMKKDDANIAIYIENGTFSNNQDEVWLTHSVKKNKLSQHL